MLIVGGLAAVSLVSVGFANWVITGATSATANNINVSVGSVDDNSLTTTIATEGENGSDLTLKFDNVSDNMAVCLINNPITYSKYGRKNSKNFSRLRRRRIRSLQLKLQKGIWRARK